MRTITTIIISALITFILVATFAEYALPYIDNIAKLLTK